MVDGLQSDDLKGIEQQQEIERRVKIPFFTRLKYIGIQVISWFGKSSEYYDRVVARIVDLYDKNTIFTKDSKKEINSFLSLVGRVQAKKIIDYCNEKKIKSITADLDDGKLDKFKEFLRTAPNKDEIDSVIGALKILSFEKDPKSASWDKFDKIMHRYEQISQDQMGEDVIDVYQNMQIALFIEVQIVGVANVAGKLFERSEYLPRALTVEEGSEHVNILARKKFSLIGEGGFKSAKLAKRVALKEFSKPKVIVSAKIKKYWECKGLRQLKTHADMERAVNDARREVNISKKLRDNGVKNIAEIHSTCEYDIGGGYKGVAINMELLEGGSLTKFGGFNGKGDPGLTPTQQISVANQLIESIYGSHNIGIRMWDLKPDNVLFRQDDSGDISIRLSDFGIAFDLDEQPMKEKYGTPGFSPPELEFEKLMAFSKEDYDPCEVWALGQTLFMMHFGEIFECPTDYKDYEKFKAAHKAQIEDKFVELERIQAEKQAEGKELGQQEEYELLIYRMLRFKPEDRIPIGEALEMIQRIKDKAPQD